MSSAPDAIQGAPLPGHIVAGKYRVERILGAGGMGVVLAAWHLVLERRVALKLLLPEAAQLPGAGERFLREGRAAARLESDHVARVLDVGVLDDGAPYLVLEYMHGADLDAVLKASGPLTFTETIDYILQAGEAIAEAHARGIVHRDLKLKNLFLTHGADGGARIKVLDFGLSKILPSGGEAEASLTATNLILGSIHTMAPEQLRGLRFADARSDLWALGVILYQLLAGRRPFEGESISAISAAIALDRPAPLSSLRPGLPSAFDTIVSRCLAKEPSARYQRMGELAQALAPFGSSRAQRSLEVIRRIEAGLAATLPAPGASRAGEVAGGASELQATAAPTTMTLPRGAGHGRTLLVALAAVTVIAGSGAAVVWALDARPLARDAPAASVVPLVMPELALPPEGGRSEEGERGAESEAPPPDEHVIDLDALPDVAPPEPPPPPAATGQALPPAASASAASNAPPKQRRAPRPPQLELWERWD